MSYKQGYMNMWKSWSEERKGNDEAILKSIRILLSKIPIKMFEKKYKRWKKEDEEGFIESLGGFCSKHNIGLMTNKKGEFYCIMCDSK